MQQSNLSILTGKQLVKVKVKTKKGEEIIECEVVLSAVGIKSNLEDIGLGGSRHYSRER